MDIAHFLVTPQDIPQDGFEMITFADNEGDIDELYQAKKEIAQLKKERSQLKRLLYESNIAFHSLIQERRRVFEVLEMSGVMELVKDMQVDMKAWTWKKPWD